MTCSELDFFLLVSSQKKSLISMYESLMKAFCFRISTHWKCLLPSSVYTHTRWIWCNIFRLSEKDLSSRWHYGTYLGVIRHSLLRKHLGWLPSPPWIRAAGAAEGDRAQAGFSRLVLVAPTTRCHLHSNLFYTVGLWESFIWPTIM